MDIRDAFFEQLFDITSKDRDVILLTADQGAWALDKFRAYLSDQFYNIGIAEQNLINVAAGLTLGGKNVFCFAIASFIIYRCYEQIKVNLCDNLIPVTLIGMGPGLSYKADGPTHHAIYDITLLGVLPITILTPHNEGEARSAAQMGYDNSIPTYIRLGKGEFPAQYGPYRDIYNEVSFIL